LHETYELSLAILFLDRLDHAQDDLLIRTLGLRLAAGQTPGGGWTYFCPVLSPADEQRVLTELRTRMYASVRDSRRPDGLAAPLWPPPLPGRSGLPMVPPRRGARLVPRSYTGDNSNIQFALLGLWAVQRHRLPMRWVFRRVDDYFREMQLEDGSWGYFTRTPVNKASGTCSGLLALAMGHGVDYRSSESSRPLPSAPMRDLEIGRGLSFLGETVQRLQDPPQDKPAPKGILPGVPKDFFIPKRFLNADAVSDLYFLWSLERVAVVYDLERLSSREWYPWAAAHLVAAQSADGSWRERYPGAIDTCFALLVLRRSNPAPDLTRSLEKVLHTEGRRPPLGTMVQGKEQPARPALSGSTTGPGRSPGGGIASDAGTTGPRQGVAASPESRATGTTALPSDSPQRPPLTGITTKPPEGPK
jgi:hypothetical protein